jgi:hypothetical protein
VGGGRNDGIGIGVSAGGGVGVGVGMAKRVVLCALLLCAACLTSSCAFVEGASTLPDGDDTMVNEAVSTLVNPIIEHDSLAAMVRMTGIEMTLPEQARVVAIRSIGEVINDVDVEVGAVLYNLRKARSDEKDISGVFEEWRTVEKMRTPHPDVGEVTLSRNSDKGIVTWNDGEYAHSIFAESGFDIATALGLVRP